MGRVSEVSETRARVVLVGDAACPVSASVRDPQNKEVVLSAKNVEALRPSRTSLMPDGQMAGLTVQDAADLLEYLVRRK